jgi:WD40 repeat protein
MNTLINAFQKFFSGSATSLPDQLQSLLGTSFLFFLLFMGGLAILGGAVPWARKDQKHEDDIQAQREEIRKQVLPGFKLRHTLHGHKNSLNQIAWSQDGVLLASASKDTTIRLWNMESGQLLHTLEGHSDEVNSDEVNSVAWSPDRRILASGSDDKTIRLWDTETGQLLQTLTKHSYYVSKVVWSPDGQTLASSSRDRTIRLWDAKTGKLLHTLRKHSSSVEGLAWSPDGRTLASASDDKTVRLWNAETGQLLQTLTEHSAGVCNVAWSPNGRTLASCSIDKTIRLRDIRTGRQTNILEGHSAPVTCVSFSSGGHLLASKSIDRTVRVWRSDTWEIVATLKQPSPPDNAFALVDSALTFHPKKPILATLGVEDTTINIWDLDLFTILTTTPITPSVRYANAKIVLVGDSSVGKTGLSLVLTDQPFVPTESTHGRHVWDFEIQETEINEGHKETRETLLWDLAGQPGYRLIHQLHLNEVAVALVVFDGRNETDPFVGVHHWGRALRQAQRVQEDSALPMKKFLVAARIDRGGLGVSRARIDTLVRELGFDGYFETSAREGTGTSELKKAVQEAIDWQVLPKVSSTELFQRIKAFLIAEKEDRRLLSTTEELYRTFLRTENAPTETEDLRAQFETCIGRVESRDLIRRLSFGNLVLLQPELLDAYASALVNAVKDEPDGLGSITEKKAQTGDFSISDDERLKDKEQEKLLLLAMVEDLLRHEIALREQADDGPHLVFPSQSTRENPDLPDPKGKAVVFDFEGPVMNIYATLAVRLSHSGLFKKKELWRNAVTYTTSVGGTYGMFLHNIGEGRGELILFFDEAASEETRFHFEKYIEAHLQLRALSETIQRRRIFTCSDCGFVVTEQIVQLRAARSFNWLDCPVCNMRILLLDKEERLTAVPSSLVQEMDRVADIQRDRQTVQTILQGKIKTGDFDVFLCHNGENKAAVKELAEKLKEKGIFPWLDEWELRPGLPWQRLLEQQIGQIKSAAVFVGSDGIGPWQQHELEAFLREFVDRGCPVIPVLLTDAPEKPQLPIFLKGMTWVDFRKQDPDPMERLIWGITGERRAYDRLHSTLPMAPARH